MSDNQKITRTLTGKVVSNKMDKTVTVLVPRTVKHPLIGEVFTGKKGTNYFKPSN